MRTFVSLLSLLVLFACGSSGLSWGGETRNWTDVQGRVIEAEMLGLDGDKVRVKFKGKEIAISLQQLSEADRKFAQEWKPEEAKADESGKSDGPGAPVGGATFDGRALVTGGEINTFEYPYTAEVIANITKKYKATDTGYKIAIAVPADFDPNRPQKVFIAMAPGNNPGQVKGGNTGPIKRYSAKAVAEGWVCIAYDSNEGIPTVHNAAYEGSVNKLKEAWPKFTTWTIVTGGVSGGAKAGISNACLLRSMDVPVRGIFLAGCNNAGNMSWGRDTYKVSKSAFGDTRVFLSTGNSDNLVTHAHVDGVKAAMKDGGVKTFREEWFDGGHDMNPDQFVMALKWFAQDEP